MFVNNENMSMSRKEQIAKSKIRGYDVRNRNKTADKNWNIKQQ